MKREYERLRIEVESTIGKEALIELLASFNSAILKTKKRIHLHMVILEEA